MLFGFPEALPEHLEGCKQLRSGHGVGRRRSSSTRSHIIPWTCSRDAKNSQTLKEPLQCLHCHGGQWGKVCTPVLADMQGHNRGHAHSYRLPVEEVTREAGPLVLVAESLEAGEVGWGSLPLLRQVG